MLELLFLQLILRTLCPAIPCDGAAFTGSAGACVCAAGYSGAVLYDATSITGGCTGSVCSVATSTCSTCTPVYLSWCLNLHSARVRDFESVHARLCWSAISACNRPSMAQGYAITEYNLTGPGFNVSVACNAGYEGEPTAGVCATEGGEYTLPPRACTGLHPSIASCACSLTARARPHVAHVRPCT